MSNIVPLQDIQAMAEVAASSKMFGFKNPQEAMAIMLLCQAEGLHPAIAMRDFHVIQGFERIVIHIFRQIIHKSRSRSNQTSINTARLFNTPIFFQEVIHIAPRPLLLHFLQRRHTIKRNVNRA